MEKLFPALVQSAHQFITETFHDQKNYAHFFGRPGLLYLFMFINQVCTNEGHQDVKAAWAVWQRVFKALGMDGEAATHAFQTALDSAVTSGKAANSGNSHLFPLLVRIVSEDVAQFDWNSFSQVQADHYALVVAIHGS
jgi:hypothetical protein